MNKRIHNPYLKFKAWLKENGIKYSDVAALLGIGRTALTLKINGQSDFSLSEIRTLKKAYSISTDIFCEDFVA